MLQANRWTGRGESGCQEGVKSKWEERIHIELMVQNFHPSIQNLRKNCFRYEEVYSEQINSLFNLFAADVKQLDDGCCVPGGRTKWRLYNIRDSVCYCWCIAPSLSILLDWLSYSYSYKWKAYWNCWYFVPTFLFIISFFAASLASQRFLLRKHNEQRGKYQIKCILR